MKNYYNNWLRGGSTLRQTGQVSAKPNTMWRNMAMILCVLMLGVGQMWADTTWDMKDVPTSSPKKLSGLTYWASGSDSDYPDKSSDSQTFPTGETGTYYINTGGSSSFQKDDKGAWKSSHPNRVFSFTVAANDSIIVYWRGNSNGARHLYVSYDASTTNRDDATAFASSGYSSGTENVRLAGKAPSAGTVYVWVDGSIRIYKIQIKSAAVSCSTPAKPDGLSAGSIKAGGGVTFTITDDESPASYDIYYSTSSTAPTGSTDATTTTTSKTKAVTGLTGGTTYYAWVRAVCDGSHKSDWVALTGSTFTTKPCEISSCGNASITYEIKVGAKGSTQETDGSDFITSATSSNTSALDASDAIGLSTMTISDGNMQPAAKASTCYATAPNMTGKLGVYNGSSYSSSYYLQFTFEVKEGYTFTPCDIEFTVQPVSNSADFRWEITDGTTSYGYGTEAGVPKGSDGGATVLTGLTSTSEMSAGTYYIRLYPNYNGSNTFRIGEDVVLRGTTAAACTAPNHVDVAATSEAGNYGWRYTTGETIKLTAKAYSTAGTSSEITSGLTYQWKKKTGESTWKSLTDGVDATDGGTFSGTTSANLQVSGCTSSNAGTYKCEVSTGAGCTTTSNEYWVRIFTLDGNYSGEDWEKYPIVWTDEYNGTVTLTNINANTTFYFKVTDNDSHWYGKNTAISKDQTNYWAYRNDATDIALNTGIISGTYTISVDVYHANDNSDPYCVLTSVLYPKKKTYLELCSDWSAAEAKYAIYYWKGDDNGWSDFMTVDACNDAIYSAEIPSWASDAFFVRFNPSKESTGNFDSEWNRSGDNESTLPTDGKDYYNSLSKGGNSQYYGSWGTFSPTTFTISYDKGTNGTGTKSDETKTCDVDFTLPSSAVFTRSGYTQTGWTTSDGGDQTHELGGSYTTDADQTFYPVWTGKTYNIKYYEEDGETEITGLSPTTYTCGVGVAELPDPDDRACYTFVGWYSEWCVYHDNGGSGYGWIDGCKKTSISTSTYGDAKFLGKWTLNSHTLAWNFNGGTTEDSYTVAGSVDCGETLDYPDPITKTGYTFSAWSSTPTEMPDEDLTITASWTANTYTVTLDPDNGNSTTTVSATYDAAMPSKLSDGETDVAVPTYTGYTFGGYYDDHAGSGKQYYTNAVASANNWDKTSATTLYAKWTQTVTLKTGSQGSGSDLTPTVAYKGTALSGFSSGHTAKGYKLLGYYTASSEGTKVLNADGTFAASSVTDYITDGKWTKANATTLYAQWEDMEITLPGTLNKANNIETGGGLTFLDDTLNYNTGSSNHLDGYAEWKVNIAQKCIYTVTINGNYNSATARQWEMYLVNGSGTTVSTCTFVKKWENGDKAETKNWDLSGIASTGTYIIRLKNITEWGYGKAINITIDPIKVTYDANGGTCATEYAYYAGSALTLPTPTKDGYFFKGWYDDETKEGDAGDSYTPDASTTLTAEWAIITDLPGTLDKDNYAEVGGGLTFINDTLNYGTGTGSKLDGYAEWKVNVAQKCVYKVTLNGTYSNGHQWEVYLVDGSGSTEATCTIDKSYSTGDRTETKNWDLSSISATGTYTVRVMNILKDGEPKLLSVTIDPVTVTYDANGGTCATESAYYAGSALTLPTPTRAGYTFEGWYSAGTKIGNAGASYTPDPVASITLYAHWTDNISGKVFSYIDGLYGDKYKAFDASTWVTSDGSDVDKTYTNATTGVQFIVDNGYWDNKTGVSAKAISSLAKFKNGTTAMSVVIPTGKIATVKIGYGAYNTGRKLMINGTEQSAATTALADGLTNAEVDAALKEITLSSKTGTLTLGASGGNIYIGRVSAEITGYVITYAAGDNGTGDSFTGTKTAGEGYTISSDNTVFTRANYTHEGWSTSADGSTKTYSFGDTYSTDAALTLYPYWEASCSTPDAPTDFSAGSITDGGVTFSITDAANAGNYDIYYSTDDDAPTGSTEATTTATAKSKEVTGLSAATTYYAWVRAVCDEDHKSDWVALNPDGDTHTFFTHYTVTMGTVTTRQHDGETVGGTISSDVSHAAEGGTVTLTATPTSGYGFVEWTIEKTSDNTDVTSSVLDGNTLTMPAYGVTVKATFATRYSITYKDYDKTTVLDLSPTYYLYGTGVPALPTPTMTGYTFDSWYSAYCVDTEHSGVWDAGCKKTSIGTSDYGSATYYASWTVNNYTLTWNLDGGKVTTAGTAAAVDETEPSGSVDYGTTITAPVVAKSGCDFAGWSPTPAETMPAANTTYTAQWATKYTVTFNAMTGGSVDPTSAQGSSVTKVTLPTPTHASYDFDGWYNTAGEKIGDAGDKINPTADITLYAKWKGSCDGAGSAIVWDFTSNEFLNSGSWSSSAGATNSAYATDGTTILTYTAGGSGDDWDSSNKQLKTKGKTSYTTGSSKKQLAQCYFTFPTLSGNAKISVTYGTSNTELKIYEATSTNIYDLSPIIILSSSSTESSTYEFDEDKTYYMVQDDAKAYYANITWTPQGSCYTVTYDGNGATSGYTNDPLQYEADASVTVADNGYTRTGYDFIGWNDKSDGSGDSYSGTFTITDDETLYAQWAQINTFTGSISGHETEWSNTGNWSLGSLPTISQNVVLTEPTVVDIAHATARQVILDQSGSNTGKLTIEPNKGLEVAGTITRTTDESEGLATRETDLVLESDEDGNASLIFNNSNACQATVQMYSIAAIDGETWNWQYVGTPFTGSIPLYNYYGSWMYKWNSGWEVVHGGDELTPFAGYCLTQESATTHVMGGTLVATDGNDQVIEMGEETDMVLANSWTAPIWIGGFTEETFTSTPATIYMFNTGSAVGGSEEGTAAAGTYETRPINSSPFTGDGLIAPMQGFFVTTVGAEEGKESGKITLKYNELVRPQNDRQSVEDPNIITTGPMYAPRRAKAAEAKPDVMKIRVDGATYYDRVVILAREDFSEDFDNGWDGENINEPGDAPMIYALRQDGTKDAVSAIPTFEGTVVGFHAGTDNNCTMTFEYDGEEIWYLNDLQTQQSTLIDSELTYTFSTSSYDNEARFIISATPIRKITTGVETVTGYGLQGTGVRKLIINDKIYIIRGGRMFTVDGQMVK